MKLSLAERETILLYNQAEPMAEVYTHDPRLMEKLELLAKKHPDQILSLIHIWTDCSRCKKPSSTAVCAWFIRLT